VRKRWDSGEAWSPASKRGVCSPGEWFFVRRKISKPILRVLRYEPLSRGNGSKPHWAEFCYRSGGETVYVSLNIRGA